MIKYILALTILLMPAVGFCADGNNAIDIFTDTVLGHNDNCPTVLNLEVLKEIDGLDLPLVGEARLQIGLGYVGSLRNLTEDNTASIIGRLIF